MSMSIASRVGEMPAHLVDADVGAPSDLGHTRCDGLMTGASRRIRFRSDATG